MRPLRLCAATACLAGILALPAGAHAADQIAGVTNDNQLELFRSDAPGNVQYTVPVSGLPAGEHIVGLDRRTATGAVYGLGATSRIYRIDLASGRALAVGNPFTPALDGSAFGFGDDPVADDLRSVSDNRQNLQIDPGTGQAAAQGALHYAAGDPGAGANPSIVAASYTNRVPGAKTTTLYGIDQARDTLVSQVATTGELKTVGALGVDVSGPGALSVAPGGVAYAALRRTGQSNPELFTINLASGAATSHGPIAPRPRNRQTQPAASPVVAITALDPVADDRTPPAIVEDLSSTLLESTLLSRGLPIKVSCDEACTVTASAHVDKTGTSLGTGNGAVVGSGGFVDVSIPLSASAKALVRRPGTLRISVQTTVKDSAGNQSHIGRIIRSQTLAQRLGGG